MDRISKAKVNKYATLKTRKGRAKEGLFLVQEKKAVSDTIRHYKPECLIILENAELELPWYTGCPVFGASGAEMKKISTLNDIPDIIAVYEIPHEEYALEARRDCFTLVLDGVSDPGNFGTIIRTAHWFGIERIFCSRECPDLYNPKVVQSTMGSIARVRIIYCDIKELLRNNQELPAYGLLLHGEDIFNKEEYQPGFIVMGNEGHGISKDLIPYITAPLTIPPVNPNNHPESLNVAIATAITLGIMTR